MTLESLTSHAESVLTLSELVDVANRLLPTLLPKDARGRVAEDVNPRLVRHYTTQGLLPEPRKEGREARYLYEHLLKLLVVRRLLAEGFSSQAIGQLLVGMDEATLIRVLDGGVELKLVPAAASEAETRRSFLERVRRSAGLAPAAELAESRVTMLKRRSAAHDYAADEAEADWPDVAAPAPAPATAPEPGHHASGEVARESSRRAEKAETTPARSRTVSLEKAFNETSWTSFTVADGLELFVRSDFSLPATRLGDEQLLDLIKLMLLNLEQRQRSRP